MKKKLSYRDKLLELAYIYNVKEIQDYTKRRKNLTTGQIELILKKNKIIIIIKNKLMILFITFYPVMILLKYSSLFVKQLRLKLR